MKKSEVVSLIKECILEVGKFEYPRGSSILPLGTVNLQTGSSKYFNIYTTWDDGTVEVWETPKNTKVLVFTAGKSHQKPGTIQQFYHDQTFRVYGRWTFIESIENVKMKTLIPKYGKSLLGYTYK